MGKESTEKCRPGGLEKGMTASGWLTFAGSKSVLNERR